MKKYVKKQPIVILILMSMLVFCAGFSYLSAAADPFYKKLLQEGKTFLAEGKYQDAVENFRIAEFGLMDEREILKELYFFYSLAFLKLGKPDEALEIIKNMETELHVDIDDLKPLPIPPSIKTDARVLKATLFKSQETKGTDAWEKIYNFEWLFWNTLQKLDDNNLNAVKNNIKRLEKIDENDTRIFYINGIVKFKKKKYKACIESLNKVVLTAVLITIDPSLRENLYYYLALSYHYLENKEQSRKFYQKISDKTTKAKLDKIIQKIKTREKNGAIDKKK
jgi:lipopolysaccharide biosynthesis regulator YciM